MAITIGKIFGWVVRKAPKDDIVTKIATNKPGRILKMQDAKHAFTVGRNYNVVPARVYQQPANIKLETTDNFAQRIAKMYPESKTGALEYENLSVKEKLEILKKRADVRAALENYTVPQSRRVALMQENLAQTTNKLKFDGHELKAKLLENPDFYKTEKIGLDKLLENPEFYKIEKIGLDKLPPIPSKYLKK